MSGTLTPFLLRHAYSLGCFPMAMEGGEIGWFEPTKRALFPIEGIHVSASLAKKLARTSVEGGQVAGNPKFVVTFDQTFEQVIRGCLRPEDNWINEEIIQAYTNVHRLGWAHSCEVWSEGHLVGGIYGIALGGCFSAESMFHRVTDASKIALWAMVERCRQLGFVIFDAQIMNSHLKSLGAIEIPKAEYLRRLERAIKLSTPWSG